MGSSPLEFGGSVFTTLVSDCSVFAVDDLQQHQASQHQ
jgi:hypothetical protein